ncbi:type IV pili methyl-accepting chemotaxis transducer N-terminal domain-containing protein [Inhella gelatinilytica]|uniref:Type IV pili methyl-accepting chemotaxis transducer N-terminal domain-containing protein n=1 Tax=Inhella gelatinilytica TaxID=2795030 RepID=A0A931IXE4_9BURK|nr:type IV pili methyl-accepting chemotaxis transducer N-terminal domain-containing protein [Inhella gelatinilytica]MBH9552403.1 type IV pili methyl-accepting chemotaxis transducer N-terminal domain-containing protein [Inhella gelatinilytica]
MFVRRRDCFALPLAGLFVAPFAAQAQVRDLNDAINKAGRQRMLSQRCAKAWLAIGQNVRKEQADKVLADSMALFDRQLVELRAFATASAPRATYSELDGAWSAYKLALVGSAPNRAGAEALLAASGKVLSLAHQGTEQLEQLSGKAVGRLVNLAGRQRMLSQRMAAAYLGASWGVQGDTLTRAVTQAQTEFQAAHAQLKAAGENTQTIRHELEAVEQQYAFFEAALRSLKAGQPDARAQGEVFTTSERILQLMDGVTSLYAKL